MSGKRIGCTNVKDICVLCFWNGKKFKVNGSLSVYRIGYQEK